jgi:hypothetical protein
MGLLPYPRVVLTRSEADCLRSLANVVPIRRASNSQGFRSRHRGTCGIRSRDLRIQHCSSLRSVAWWLDPRARHCGFRCLCGQGRAGPKQKERGSDSAQVQTLFAWERCEARQMSHAACLRQLLSSSGRSLEMRTCRMGRGRHWAASGSRLIARRTPKASSEGLHPGTTDKSA